MELKKMLGGAFGVSESQKIVRWIGDDEKRFQQLVDVFLSGPYRMTQRASGPLLACARTNPGLVTPFLTQLILSAEKQDVSPSIRRNVMRILQYANIPARLRGRVLHLCLGFLKDRKEQVAVRVFSMTVAVRISMGEPDLQRELKMIIELNLSGATPAFASRARKHLSQLSAG